MTEIARVSDYEGLVKALRARRIELGLTHLAVDEIAGLQTGYTGKIECGIKRLGAMSLTAILGTLGVELLVMRSSATNRNSSATSSGYSERHKIMGKKGGQIRGARLSRDLRRSSARKAGLARWAKRRREKRTRPQVEEER